VDDRSSKDHTSIHRQGKQRERERERERERGREREAERMKYTWLLRIVGIECNTNIIVWFGLSIQHWAIDLLKVSTTTMVEEITAARPLKRDADDVACLRIGCRDVE
jgi:hypothetical protein